MTSKETEAEYAFWTSKDQPFQVTYSLNQFHEIDFEVNEGFRRIPHGGIEIGGLLFGRSEPAGVRIEAFRPIECEHATGPSFTLSDRDLDELQKQISGSASNPELAGLEIVGWFIAHTRASLRLNDRELAIFDRFFTKPNQLTLLVKPERFQPTRFAFFVRKPDGSLERDGAASAVILPLAGRAAGSGSGPIASIPAPAEKPAPAASPADKDRASINKEALRPKPMTSEAPQPTIPSPVKDSQLSRHAGAPEPPLRHQVTRVRTPDETLAETSVRSSPETETSETETVTSLTTIPKEKKLRPISEIRRRRTEYVSSGRESANVHDESTTYNARLALILFFAAALGCGVGYWAYRQIPAPLVPLAVHPEASDLVITWPTEQTRESSYAAIRVNDGAQQPLSSDEKMAGAARITPTSWSNVKIELIVQHSMRDSRGIVRYVSGLPGISPTETSK